MVQKGDMLSLEIIQHLLRREDHVRSIAKNLGESHSTISRRLLDLKEENVIDSRDQGKNKTYFLRDNIIAKHRILQAEIDKSITFITRHPEIGILFEEIKKKTSGRLIVLFGSYAKGLEGKDSDIDIYIETKDREEKRAVESVHSRVSVKIGSFDIESPLIKEIIKNHVIIKGFEDFYEKLVP